MAFTWHESSHIAGFDWRLVFIKKDNYASGPQTRDNFENGLSRLLVQQTNLGLELDNITRQSKPSINSCWKMKLRSRPTLEESLQVDHPCNSYTPEEKLPTATNLYTLSVHWRSWSFYRDTWSAGSAIVEDFPLDVFPEFVFKNAFLELGNSLSLVVLQRKSIIWQPSSLLPQLQEPILADLFGLSQFKITYLFLWLEFIFLELQKKNRTLAEARSVLISAITRLHSWYQATNRKQSAQSFRFTLTFPKLKLETNQNGNQVSAETTLCTYF